MLARHAASRAPTPPRGSFPVTEPSLDPRPLACTATWIGHSTALLQMRGRTILTDPVWSERAFPVQWAGPRRIMPPALSLESLPPLDLVLLSHNHYDHMDKPTIRRLARLHPAARWVAPLGLGDYLRDFGVVDVIELDWWQRAEVAGVEVTATPARHFSARRFGDRNRSLWSGFALEREGRRVFFAGDTAWHPEFDAIGERCGPFDLLLVPVGAYDPRWFMHVGHVDPEEAMQIYQAVAAPHGKDRDAWPLMLALHWGTFRLTDEPMDEPPQRALAAAHAAGVPADKLWIAAFGETRAW